MYKLLLPCLLFVAISCGESVSVDKTMNQVTEQISEVAEVFSLKKDARLIGGEKSAVQLEIEESIKKIEANQENDIVGYWVGSFGKNKINIVVSEINEGDVLGYSICAGNHRPLSGVLMHGESFVELDLKEPGDDKYDGRFTARKADNSDELIGEWTPFKEKGNTAKTFTLRKTKFKYNPNVGKQPEGSLKELTVEDVENMNEEELAMMRNEIYARHGYCFKNKEYRYVFESEDWYVPMGVDIRDQLTDIEVKNIDLLYEYESYYEDYYDGYGR